MQAEPFPTLPGIVMTYWVYVCTDFIHYFDVYQPTVRLIYNFCNSMKPTDPRALPNAVLTYDDGMAVGPRMRNGVGIMKGVGLLSCPH